MYAEPIRMAQSVGGLEWRHGVCDVSQPKGRWRATKEEQQGTRRLKKAKVGVVGGVGGKGHVPAAGRDKRTARRGTCTATKMRIGSYM